MEQNTVFDLSPFWSLSDSKGCDKKTKNGIGVSQQKKAHMHAFLIRTLLILLHMLGKQTDCYRPIKRMLHHATTLLLNQKRKSIKKKHSICTLLH